MQSAWNILAKTIMIHGFCSTDAPGNSLKRDQWSESLTLTPYAPRQNHLVGDLPPEIYVRALPYRELVPMHLCDVLYESGIRLRHVYFPIDTIIYLLWVMEDRSSSDI